MLRLAVAFGLALALGACSSGAANGSYVRSTPAVTQPAQTTPNPAFRAPQVMRGAGVDSVIGAGANDLTSRFGEARIDLAEGDARKLQFTSDDCVLDVYLYPLEANAAPVATHVEARAREGGGEADRANCIAEVESAARRR
ncbi:hypothetical protein [uncultured Erythrobacter sp.]|uniref:hypothetical protein n=1 Tax=uncultured Erythrobacter sp. TaxID=263913 RepID=UPI00260326C0|nr:hypothetical protein [uncultured Erythrobacter sp.]